MYTVAYSDQKRFNYSVAWQKVTALVTNFDSQFAGNSLDLLSLHRSKVILSAGYSGKRY